ncbi:DUF3667 domain-containing protein [Flavobacterium sp.]|uniref:DUF3667 domain-containing protein n=1 Tax=Flavobacterium sp. TaxID=239 RepID=UPI003528E9CB
MSRKEVQYRGEKCLNCFTPLDISEKYCHHCGQLNSTKKITLKDFFEEFLSNFYAYDSKIRNSIVYLFTKPGVLPKLYIKGQRTTFANPFRLFLNVSIILFLTMSILSDFYDNNNPNKEKQYAGGIVKINPSHETKEEETLDSVTVNQQFLGNKKTLKLAHINKDSIYNEAFLKKNSSNIVSLATNKILTFKNFREKFPEKGKSETFKELQFENSNVNIFLYNKAEKFKTKEIMQEAGGLIVEKLPFLLFLTIPFIALIFWITFYRKEYNYTDHLIFTYSFYTFLFLFVLFTELIAIFSINLSNFITSIGFFLILPYYLYRALRNFYNFSRWKTILKFVILHPLFLIIMIISSFIMFSLGFVLL